MAHEQNGCDVVPILETIFNKHTKTKYERGKFYGKGGFGRCYEVKEAKTNRIYAAKIVPKRALHSEYLKAQMMLEIRIHNGLCHKNVVAYHGTFEDNNFVYLLLELCRLGSLAELHSRRKVLTEPETRYFMKQILEGTQYLHTVGVVHRDLKLGNLLLSEGLTVKICDFGLAAEIEREEQLRTTVCGTPNYVAPEILLMKGHRFEVDIWSAGCVMYTLLVGKPPFEKATVAGTYEQIIQLGYTIPSQVSINAAKLIHRMLQPDPKKRPKIQEMLKSEFFEGYIPSTLPHTCLTVAPRPDTIKSKESLTSTRKPLLEINGVHNIQKVSSQGSKASRAKTISPGRAFFGRSETLSAVSAPRQTGLEVNSECKTPAYAEKYLKALQKQLNQVMEVGVHSVPTNEDELTEPAAQPVVWVTRWNDYSVKYGFAYQLSDGTLGVMFNDETSLVALADCRNIHYIERDGTEYYYTVDTTPAQLDKKMRVLYWFRKVMHAEHVTADNTIVSAPQSCKYDLSRTPYLYNWITLKDALLMQLTNGTVQVNFKDHTKIIMCPLVRAVTYIDPKKHFRTYKFSTIIQNGCDPCLLYALSYASRKIKGLIRTAK